MTALEISRAPGVLRTHWRWPLGLPALLCALVVAGYALIAPAYRASVAIILDSRGVERLLETPRDSYPTPTALVSTDLDVIRSDAVLRRVVNGLLQDNTSDRQRLAPTPAEQALLAAAANERREAWTKETKGAVPIDAWLLRWLGKALQVQRAAMDSNVVTVQFDHPDADTAAVLANAVARAYLAVALELSLAPTRQAAQFFEEQIGQTRDVLARKQALRSEFQRNNGLVSVNEGADLESALLTEMATAATLARTQGAQAAARSGTAVSNPANAPDVLQAALVQQLSAELARQRATLAELSSRLGASHPQVQSQQQHIAELENRLQNATTQIVDSVALSSRSASGGDRAVQAMLQQQRDRVMALKQAREHLTVLQQDVDAAQRAYDMAMQRHAVATARNESELSNAHLLAPASAPPWPTRPPLLLAMVFAALAGGLLGLGAAFIAEQRRPLLRLDDDIVEQLGLPVLAAMPKLALPRSARRWTAFWPLAAQRSAA